MVSQRASKTVQGSQRHQIAKLAKIAEDFAHDNAALRAKVAELESKRTEQWVPLKSADRGAVSYNTVRRWSERDLIKNRRVGGRIFVDAISLREFMAMRSNAARG